MEINIFVFLSEPNEDIGYKKFISHVLNFISRVTF